METPDVPDETRRRLLRAMAVAPVFIALPSLFGASCSGSNTKETAIALSPTLSCSDDDDDPTVAQTEGPFFTARSPERKSLIDAGAAGTRLVVSGLVLTRSCKPVSNALLDFWHTDNAGNYDNETYRFRGHQFTDANGAFRLDTIIPGQYPGRTRHIHVKAQAPGKSILTTQLYFPNDPSNARDGIFHSSLVIAMSGTGSTQEGRFNFVLDLA